MTPQNPNMPVPANIAFEEILEHDGKYAVVGLPCHIHGLRKAQELNKKLRERIVFSFAFFVLTVIIFSKLTLF